VFITISIFGIGAISVRDRTRDFAICPSRKVIDIPVTRCFLESSSAAAKPIAQRSTTRAESYSRAFLSLSLSLSASLARRLLFGSWERARRVGQVRVCPIPRVPGIAVEIKSIAIGDR